MKKNSESGNALWFILLAVVLIGLLTMVVSRSGSSVDQSGDIEQLKLKASQMMRFGKSVEAAIQQLILNGCSEKEISFENTVSNIDYTNASSPSDDSCHVFGTAGAGLNWPTFSSTVFPDPNDEIVFHKGVIVYGVGTDSGSSNSENDLIVGIAISDALCDRINKDLGINPASDTDITSDMGDWDQGYTGTFAPAALVGDTGGPTAEALYGKDTGCFIDEDGNYAFYHVVLAR